MNPKLDRIRPDQPVCQFPRSSYNRMATILEKMRGGRGINIRRCGDEWTIAVNVNWLMQFLEAEVSPMIDSAENETAASVAAGGGGGSGYTGTRTVVTDVVWDGTYHKLKKVVEAWTYSNGVLTSVAAAVTSDIVQAVPEMP